MQFVTLHNGQFRHKVGQLVSMWLIEPVRHASGLDADV
jgi:hypothetical protein